MQKWDDGWKVLLDTLDSLTDDDVDKMVTIYAKQVSVLAAWQRAAGHVSYHTGQIVIVAKMFAGEDWEALYIPKKKE